MTSLLSTESHVPSRHHGGRSASQPTISLSKDASGASCASITLFSLPSRGRVARDTEALEIASHELRTPLATMLATVEIMAEHPSASSADLQQLIGKLQSGVVWMTGLLENLSVWSHLENEQIVIDRSRVPVHEWLTQAIEVMQPLVTRRSQSIRWSCPSPAPLVAGDSQRLAQVVVNLITNASRYGSPNDVIEVEVTTSPGSSVICVQVRDHGIGIAPNDQARLFERHYRSETARRKVPGGRGLGLHIARSIVELHGGRIGVESAEGEGTCFWFTLPIAPS